MKVCISCFESKIPIEFPKLETYGRKKGKTKRSKVCKSCMKLREDNKESFFSKLKKIFSKNNNNKVQRPNALQYDAPQFIKK